MTSQQSEGYMPAELVDALGRVANGLVATLGSNWEIVVHDFGRLPNSIVAIAGDLTGRTVGGPMTGFGFQLVSSSMENDVLNYPSVTPDGRKLKSSTMFIRDRSGKVIGCVCVNLDLTELMIAQGAIERLCKIDEGERPKEVFARDISEVLNDYLEWTLKQVDVPVQLMQKEQKLQVIESLERLGVFQIKGAVDIVAQALLSSRYTVYNYLEEVRARNPLRV
ncbi:MAG TPA: PAS domain-containing protein [Bacillota bacterium]|jgi:predicted transcriptional regulator YheO|nr:PAS domain-containing protein [Bacillota bacterium]